MDILTKSFSEELLNWYHRNRRALPWREEPTPYHVWISEIMLQQTRVEAVKGYYARFLAQLPDVASLAGAGEIPHKLIIPESSPIRTQPHLAYWCIRASTYLGLDKVSSTNWEPFEDLFAAFHVRG